MSNKLVIVSLFWNSGEDLEVLAPGVDAGAPPGTHWFIIDNHSRPEEAARLENVYRSLTRVTPHIITNTQNYGIPYAQNQALRNAQIFIHEPYDVLLLDCDTMFLVSSWYNDIMEFYAAHPRAGAIGFAASQAGVVTPVFHHDSGHWYQHPESGNVEAQGESVDNAGAFVPRAVMQHRLIFDADRYPVYDGYDQDWFWRIRSWGFEVWQMEQLLLHYGSRSMRRTDFHWESAFGSGGAAEWTALRADNISKWLQRWRPWIKARRARLADEAGHLAAMNAALVAEAPEELKAVPSWSAVDHPHLATGLVPFCDFIHQ